MGTNHLTRKQALRAGLETTYGTYTSPTLDIPILDDIDVKPWAGQMVERGGLRPYLGTVRGLPVGEYATISFSIEMSGYSLAAVDALLKAGPLAAATTVASPITGTAQAGSTSTTIKLASGASATDDIYTGMQITLTGGTGSGGVGLITGYVGSTKVATISGTWGTTPDATTTYSITSNVSYAPVSTWGSSTSVTLEYDIGEESSTGSVRHTFVGCRGSVALEMQAGGLPRFRFTFWGLVYSHADATLPTVNFSSWVPAVEVSTANTGTGMMIAGVKNAVLQSLSIDAGMSPIRRLAVNDDSIRLPTRAATGRASIACWKLSEADFWTKLRQGSESAILLRHGTVAGNMVTVFAPSAQITDASYTSQDEICHIDLTFRLNTKSSAGNDELKLTAF